MDIERIKKYAQLLARMGIAVQEGQDVEIQASLDQPEFVAMVVEECYKCGAKNVRVEWSYPAVSKLNLIYKTLEELSIVDDVQKAKLQRNIDKLTCKLYIMSDDPDAMAGTDSKKVAQANMARYPIIKTYRDQLENKYQWCIAAVPGKDWAKKIFPDLNADEAVEALWEAILTCARIDEDPLLAWQKHNEDLANRCKFLNDYKFASLEYKSENGTDFTVGLIDTGIFAAGEELALGTNVRFNPNIPSEEVFTSPKRGVAEGKVVATKPLSYQGKLIENFWVEFKDGKVVAVGAEKNEELLKQMVAMDEGAAYLGECALIAYYSPINNTNILFYNTLFDENASCHLALGRGFANCLEGYENMTNEQIEHMGINSSMIHVDFMIGSKDMSIVGITKTGERVQIFKNGNWAF